MLFGNYIYQVFGVRVSITIFLAQSWRSDWQKYEDFCNKLAEIAMMLSGHFNFTRSSIRRLNLSSCLYFKRIWHTDNFAVYLRPIFKPCFFDTIKLYLINIHWSSVGGDLVLIRLIKPKRHGKQNTCGLYWSNGSRADLIRKDHS